MNSVYILEYDEGAAGSSIYFVSNDLEKAKAAYWHEYNNSGNLKEDYVLREYFFNEFWMGGGRQYREILPKEEA